MTTNDLPKGLPILCLDFDGVIHSYESGWKGALNIPDDPVPGALEFIVKAVDHFQVCIYSSRSRYLFGKFAMRMWLGDKYFDTCMDDPYPSWIMNWVRKDFKMSLTWEDNVNRAIRKLLKKIQFPTRKPAAFIQIDDRAVCFTGTFPTVSELKTFSPWNRKALEQAI